MVPVFTPKMKDFCKSSCVPVPIFVELPSYLCSQENNQDNAGSFVGVLGGSDQELRWLFGIKNIF